MPAERSVYDAISHPVRRRILDELSKNAAPVHALVECFDISQQGVSKHLRILTDAGLAQSRRQGQENIYHLNTAPLEEVRDWLKDFWKERLHGFKTVAEEEKPYE
jgi:DNA-binding transcriptional ArsR family regulator